MCAHIFFRLSFSLFYAKVLNISNIAPFTLTILTLCVIIFSPITTASISHFRAANAIADCHFSQKKAPLSEHFHAIFSQQTTRFFMFLGAWLHQSSVVCGAFGELFFYLDFSMRGETV